MNKEQWIEELKRVSGIVVPDAPKTIIPETSIKIGGVDEFHTKAKALLTAKKKKIGVDLANCRRLEQELESMRKTQVVRTAVINPTPMQLKALEKLAVWLKSTDSYFVLKGYAGVGKTFVVSEFSKTLDKKSSLFTAPTNKATKVLKRLLPGHSCRTIYSALSLKMAEREDELVLVSSEDKFNLSGYRVIVVDESSMLNNELMIHVRNAAARYGIKFLFVGDPAQLPPVGEEMSPVFALYCDKTTLTEVVRHDNQILEIATHIRKAIVKDIRIEPISLSLDGPRCVWQLSNTGFFNRLQTISESGYRSCKAIAWRNNTVDNLNEFIRGHLYSAEELKTGFWLPNDSIVVTRQIGEGRNTLATVDDEGIVLISDISKDPETDFMCYNLSVKMETGITIPIRVIHENSVDKYQRLLRVLASEARNANKISRKTAWGAYWSMTRRYDLIRHSYAITAHRSQGSTFENIFVEAGDILANSDRDTAYRCLYVAASRASHRLYLTGFPR